MYLMFAASQCERFIGFASNEICQEPICEQCRFHNRIRSIWTDPKSAAARDVMIPLR